MIQVELWLKNFKKKWTIYANCAKKWDLIIKADRMSMRQYSFLEAMNPENIIKRIKVLQ